MAEERVQRRLAAILAADVVGYSRLMEADEEGTLARMKTLRKDVIEPKIANHGGRIFKTTGDGFLAEFGFPQTRRTSIPRINPISSDTALATSDTLVKY